MRRQRRRSPQTRTGPQSKVLYQTHVGPQTAFMLSEAQEVLYGGTQGAGKSYALRAYGVNYCMTYPGAQVVLFRRTYKQLEDSHIIAIQKEVPQEVASYGVQAHTLFFNNGSLLQFRHCEKDGDYADYFTTEFDAMLFDEVTTFTERQYIELIGRCRSVKPWWPGRRIRCSGMPVDVGRAWVKARWIDGRTPNEVYDISEDEGGMSRQFIPAKLEDNTTLMQRDPEYILSLRALPYEEYQARVLGNWEITSDQYFVRWRPYIHVCEPFDIPPDWDHYLAVDYGFNAPYAALWFARPPGTDTVFFYREHYGKGVRLDEQVFQAWQATTLAGEKLKAVILDPSMFGQVNVKGEKISPMSSDWAKQFGMVTSVVRGNNDRVPGWRLMREMIDWKEGPSGKVLVPPKMFVFSLCPNLARTVPLMVADKNNREDLNSEAEDHAVDAARYGLSYILRGRGRTQHRRLYLSKRGLVYK